MTETTAKYRSDESEVRMLREFYSVEAVAQFKKDFWPADPFDGCLADSHYLDVPDLVTLYRAAAALKSQGNEVFAKDLIQHWKNDQLVVKINHLYLDAKRQRILEVDQLLQQFFYGDCESFKTKRQEIMDMGDAQLVEFVRQVEESLELTPREMKVRFPMQNASGFKGTAPVLGLDTSEVVAFQLDKHGDLYLWCRGTPDSVVITEKEIGAEYFADLLTLICSDFQHIDDAKPRIALLADLRQPLNLDQ